jgi:hypothetical protein
MKSMTQISAFFLAAALLSAPAFGSAQDPNHQQDNSTKQDMRNAGHDTKNAAKDAGRGTKQGSEKAYHSTKNGTKKAWSKTKNTTKGAVDGGKEGAHQPPQK